MKPFPTTVFRAGAMVALVFSSVSAGAQTQSAESAAGTSGVSGPTVVVSPTGSASAPAAAGMRAGPISSTLGNVGSGSAVTVRGAAAAQASPNSGFTAPAAAAESGAFLPGNSAPAAAAVGETGVVSNPAAVGANGVVPNSDVPAAGAAAVDPRVGAVRAPGAAAADASPSAARASAHSVLTGAAGRVSAANAVQNAGGDALSVHAALNRVFEAEINAPGGAASPSVAGRAQDVREQISQKVGIANTAEPADAPGLYLDAIKTAQDALPAGAAAGVAEVVRGFAAKKADLSLGDLAGQAYRAAADGAGKETERQLSAFDKWESLLGAPGAPLVSNLAELKADVRSYLPGSSAAPGRSLPHVWFERRGESYAAKLPTSSKVLKLSAGLAAGFALGATDAAAASPIAAAYRAYAADPSAWSGRGLVYRARRELGDSVPAAALAAGRFWLRALLEAAWRRLVALFAAPAGYDLARRDGKDALRRDAGLARAARAEATAALTLAGAERLTVARARAAIEAARRAERAYRPLADESLAGEIQEQSAAFESAVAAANLGDADELTPAAAAPIVGPGGLAHWTELMRSDAGRRLADARLTGADAASLVNLGAPDGAAAAAAAHARELGAAGSFVALDDQLWARGSGPAGAVRLAADLRPSAAGGSLELTVENGGAALARRLEDLGLSVSVEGASLRAALGPDDAARAPDELAFIAAGALAASLGRGADGAPGLSALAAARDADAAALARRLDGNPLFAVARVLGLVDADAALAPIPVTVAGRVVPVSALRDPDGLLDYAVALDASGAPLDRAARHSLLSRVR
jgi:hypothetical protein